MAYREPGLVHAPPPDFSRTWRRYRLLRWLSGAVLVVPLSFLVIILTTEESLDRQGVAFILYEAACWLAWR